MSKHRTRKRAGAESPHRCGFVSILGRPNAGKSTLVNALVGQKIAIVTDKPQTTRTSIQGVWTSDAAQIVFLDTPGIHAAASPINRRMMQAVAGALDGRDLLLFVADATREPRPEDQLALEWVKHSQTPAFAVLNKVDLLSDKGLLLPLTETYKGWHEFEEFFPVSAQTGEGLEQLRAAMIQRLPLGPACFPADYLTDQPERFLVAETIREKVLLVTRQEVPHSVAVTIEEWTETPRLFKIAATIHVERNGQKPIVIGAAGARLKEIGTQARGDCEKLLGKKMFLQLFVKVSEKWREREEFLNQLDWRTASPPPAPPVLGETMDSRITPPALAETMDAPTVPPAPAESTGSTEGGNEHNGE
jgi:GTP-binding protein Era